MTAESTCPICERKIEPFYANNAPLALTYTIVCSECGRYIVVTGGIEKFENFARTAERQELKEILSQACAQEKIVVWTNYKKADVKNKFQDEGQYQFMEFGSSN